MDIIVGVIGIIAALLLLALAGVALFVAGCILVFVVFPGLPLILGLVGCVFLWISGHSNWGVIVLVAGGFLWPPWYVLVTPLLQRLAPDFGHLFDPDIPMGGGGYSGPPGTKAIYDKDGHVTGYVDKE